MNPSVHSYAIWKDSKSLAQVWTCSSQSYVESPQMDIDQVRQD
jgi:hypothetical protein